MLGAAGSVPDGGAYRRQPIDVSLLTSVETSKEMKSASGFYQHNVIHTMGLIKVIYTQLQLARKREFVIEVSHQNRKWVCIS